MLLNFITILGFNFIVITILWISSLKTRRADFIDIYWGPSFFFSFLLALVINNSFSVTEIICLFLITIWGFRLGIYLLIRNINKTEDIRYVKIREARGDIGLYLTAYLIQIILIPIISLPLISILNTSIDLSFVHWVGILIALSGILIETIADMQLSKFKLDLNNTNKVMDKGLWYYSRHPNYFGDSLFWVGYYNLLFCIIQQFINFYCSNNYDLLIT